MPQSTFRHLLQDFTKSVGLDLEVPSAEDLESFEFTHEGIRCMVRPAGDAAHVIVEADALRLDSLPVLERSQAVRFLHGLNRAALADEMVSALEAARSLARSLRILSQADNAPMEESLEDPAPASSIPCPLQLA
jgi:hypothetical protein